MMITCLVISISAFMLSGLHIYCTISEPTYINGNMCMIFFGISFTFLYIGISILVHKMMIKNARNMYPLIIIFMANVSNIIMYIICLNLISDKKCDSFENSSQFLSFVGFSTALGCSFSIICYNAKLILKWSSNSCCNNVELETESDKLITSQSK